MLELQASTIVFTIINLLILYVILKKVLFGRVNRVIQARAELVRQSLSDAEGKAARADALRAEYEEKLAQARAEAAGIVAQAKDRGAQEYQDIIETAVAETLTEMTPLYTEADETARAELEASGLEFTELTDEQFAQIREIAQPVYDDVSEAIGSEVVDGLMAALA